METTQRVRKKRQYTLPEKDSAQRECAIVVIADGFDETETVAFLSLLRQAGLCVKSVGLTSGLTNSARGVWLKPDLTFTDLDSFMDVTSISIVILPGEGQNLAKLENDPRVHRLLRRVVAQQGLIAVGTEGLRIVRAAEVWGDGLGETVLIRQPKQPPEAFARDLVSRLS